MSTAATQERLAIKTPEAAFEQMLRQEFGFSRRVSRELLSTAQEMLLGSVPATGIRPGQIRQVVTSLKAPFGPPLSEADKVVVTLTVDAGVEDGAVKAQLGVAGLRRAQILRLTEEALEQGGVLTQEDLARALQVSPRTVRRAVGQSKAAGYVVSTRGQVKGVGRGQTHKVRIIELWLERTGYDQIVRQTYHSPQAIKRYIGSFLRVVLLHRKGLENGRVAYPTQSSGRLVQDYLAVYQVALGVPHRRAKLEEELARVGGRPGQGQSEPLSATPEEGKRGERSR